MSHIRLTTEDGDHIVVNSDHIVSVVDGKYSHRMTTVTTIISGRLLVKEKVAEIERSILGASQ